MAGARYINPASTGECHPGAPHTALGLRGKVMPHFLSGRRLESRDGRRSALAKGSAAASGPRYPAHMSQRVTPTSLPPPPPPPPLLPPPGLGHLVGRPRRLGSSQPLVRPQHVAAGAGRSGAEGHRARWGACR